MQMLSSSVPCPRCGSDAMMTLFGPTGADVSLAEITFSCTQGHEVPQDVTRAEVLGSWNAYRTRHQQAS